MSDYDEDDPWQVVFSILLFFIFILIVFILGK